MECGTCKGKGKIMKTIQLGPGMISQSIGPCDSCDGIYFLLLSLVFIIFNLYFKIRN